METSIRIAGDENIRRAEIRAPACFALKQSVL